MKYIVVATVWDKEAEKQVEVAQGSFDNYTMAAIFRDAYNNYYKSNARVVELSVLLN